MALPYLGSGGELCASFSPSSSAPKCKDSGHHCQGTCLSLTLCKAGAAAPCAVREQHQRSEGPLGHWGSQPGPGPSLLSDPRGVPKASSAALKLLEGPGWRLPTGNTNSIQTTAGKQLRVRLQRDFLFPGALTVKRSRVKAEGSWGRGDGQEQGPQRGAAMGDVFIRHIELLGYEKRFFPSQHYVSMQ